MKGSQLTVYAATQGHRMHHLTVVDWILEETRKIGIVGATVVEVTESIDMLGKYHAARFFELADQPLAVTIVAEDTRIEALLANLRQGRANLFYTRASTEYELLGEP
jgi:PII-like signaling protein